MEKNIRKSSIIQLNGIPYNIIILVFQGSRSEKIEYVEYCKSIK